MVSLIKYGGHQNKNDMNFVGKSTDTKPIKTFDRMPISNGSTFYEMDTETEYMYDEELHKWTYKNSGGASALVADDTVASLVDANMLAAVSNNGELLTDEDGKIILM